MRKVAFIPGSLSLVLIIAGVVLTAFWTTAYSEIADSINISAGTLGWTTHLVIILTFLLLFVIGGVKKWPLLIGLPEIATGVVGILWWLYALVHHLQWLDTYKSEDTLTIVIDSIFLFATLLMLISGVLFTRDHYLNQQLDNTPVTI
jgi:hypothetical protein